MPHFVNYNFVDRFCVFRMEDWPMVAELLASHDDNLQKVESLAQREIFSIEAPVFNGLRDILPFSILTALVS